MKTPGQTINGMPTGAFVTLSKVAPVGSLQARRDKAGAVSLYWRYSVDTKSERVLIGLYDSSAPPRSLTPSGRGYSVAAAVRAAEVMAVEHRQHRADGGRPELIRKAKAVKAAQAEEKDRALNFTLKALLTDYADYLRMLGKASAYDALNLFQNHVFIAWPDLAALPACEITDEQMADMMRRLIEAGKGRTANKLRTYTAAAYALAKSARTNPVVPVKFKGYGIRLNPAADTSPDRASNKADKNPLTHSELCAYWSSIKQMGGFEGAVLTLHLLTGGQRIEQFIRLRTKDAKRETITLFDGKGRPGAGVREVVLPLTEPATDAVMSIRPTGQFAISLTGGTSHIWNTAFSKWSRKAGADIKGFTPKRVRSGVETLLAKLGVSLDTRGRLQSHGISGVQSKHYDGHDYLIEKKQALELLLQALEHGASDNVALPKIS
jgi:integrase